MIAEIEWEDSELPPPAPPAPRHRGRWIARVAAVVALGIAAGLVTHESGGHGSPDAGPPAPSASQQVVAAVSAAATTAPTTFVRPDAPRGGCAVLGVGQSPAKAVTVAAHPRLAGYALLDAGRTLDEYGGLCSLTVRERDAAGSVLVVVVAARTQGARRAGNDVTTAQATTTAGAVAAAYVRTVDGWSITVGVLGKRADEPSTSALLALAQDPAVRW